MDPRPLWSTMEFQTHLCSRFQKPSTPCSPVLTQPSPCRTFRSDKDTSPCLHALLLAWTCQRLLQVMYHMFPHQTHAPQTLWTLKQLPIPKRPWNSITMDFIEKLPPSSSYTSILVIVDHLSKQTLFILTHDTITSPQLAQLFVLHVFSKH